MTAERFFSELTGSENDLRFVVDALARQFTSLGHKVVVLAPRPRPPWRIDDAKRLLGAAIPRLVAELERA